MQPLVYGFGFDARASDPSQALDDFIWRPGRAKKMPNFLLQVTLRIEIISKLFSGCQCPFMPKLHLKNVSAFHHLAASSPRYLSIIPRTGTQPLQNLDLALRECLSTLSDTANRVALCVECKLFPSSLSALLCPPFSEHFGHI